MSHVDKGRLHAFLDGELEAAAEMQIEDHLADCLECAARFDEVVEVHARAGELLGALHLEGSPPEYQELAARAEEGRSQIRRGPSLLGPGLAWAATLVLAFFLGWQAGERSDLQAPAVPAERSRASDAPVSVRPAPEQEESVPTEPSANASSDIEETHASAEQEAPGEPERSEMVVDRPALRPGARRQAAVPEGPEREGSVAALPQRTAEPVLPAGRSMMAAAGPVPPEANAPGDGFTRIAPSSMAALLGAEPLRPPGSDLREAAAGPDTIFGIGDGEVLRTTWDLPGRTAVVVLWQRRPPSRPSDSVSEEVAPPLEQLPAAAPATVRSDGVAMLQWEDPRGYLVRIAASVPLEELRRLALGLEVDGGG